MFPDKIVRVLGPWLVRSRMKQGMASTADLKRKDRFQRVLVHVYMCTGILSRLRDLGVGDETSLLRSPNTVHAGP